MMKEMMDCARWLRRRHTHAGGDAPDGGNGGNVCRKENAASAYYCVLCSVESRNSQPPAEKDTSRASDTAHKRSAETRNVQAAR